MADCRQCWIRVRKKNATWDRADSLFFFLTWIFLWILFFPTSSCPEEWVRAKWVADGDTIVLENGDIIRYIGIDAPEIDHKTNVAEPYGFVSRKFNKKLVLSEKLRLESDQRPQDRFGRRLSYVFLDNGVFVNQVLIENGYAFYLYHKANVKYQDVLLKKQQEAMASKRGVWKNWREKAEQYIGNINSKRFHIPACPYGQKTVPRNLILFESAWDAFWHGYSPCRQCLNIGDFTSHDP
jgi:micrococcal nuclease